MIGREVVSTLTGVVLGAAITIWFDEWRYRRNKKRQTVYLSIRVICMLEDFVAGCAAVAKDDGEPDKDDCLLPQIKLPSIDFSSLDVDWQVLSLDLMSRILNLPSRAEKSKRIIEHKFEYDFAPFYREAYIDRQLKFTELGLDGCELIDKLGSGLTNLNLQSNHISLSNYFRAKEQELLIKKKSISSSKKMFGVGS